METEVPLAAPDPARSATVHSLVPYSPQRRRGDEVRSFEDLPDPAAQARGLSAQEILIDRVSDITQIKRLVTENRVPLLTAWHRNVRENAFGDRDYGAWASEADRLLMGASFMARTLNRHEALAVLTAETVALAEAEAGERAPVRDDPFAAPPTTQPAGVAVMPADRGPAARPAMQMQTGLPQRETSVLQMLPQAVLRRTAAMLECGGWRTHLDTSAGVPGLDIFAERNGVFVGIRCLSGHDEAAEDAVRETADAGLEYGTDAVAVVSPDGFARSARAAAAASGVLLLEQADLPELERFLPAERAGVGAGLAHGPRAVAE